MPPPSSVCLTVNLNWRVQLTPHLLLSVLQLRTQQQMTENHNQCEPRRAEEEEEEEAKEKAVGVTGKPWPRRKHKVSLHLSFREVIFLEAICCGGLKEPPICLQL